MVNAELTSAGRAAPFPPPGLSARRALLLKRKERIENQLAALDARKRHVDRRRDTRRKVIVGAAVLAHAKLDAEFAARLNDVLSRAVVRPADRAFLAGQGNMWGSAANEATKECTIRR